MALHVSQSLRYRTDGLSSRFAAEVRLTPRDWFGRVCAFARLVCEPRPAERVWRVDAHGNAVGVLVFSRPSPSLRIEVQAEVRGAGAATWTPGADAARDAADGVRPDPAVAEFARRHAPGGSALQDALALSDALDRRLDYDPSATSTRTTAAEALALGRGVCQDFSQILVEALESLGHRARYVGGWLLRESGTAMDFMGGELHAWVAVDAGEGRWHAIDPCAGPVGPDHLPLAWGSRFADVVPVTFPGPAAAPRCLGTTVTARRTETGDREAARS